MTRRRWPDILPVCVLACICRIQAMEDGAAVVFIGWQDNWQWSIKGTSKKPMLLIYTVAI
ncbi:MAG: hypothetical protein ACOC2T_03175 [Planctomycetota bacterium]